MVKIEGLDRAVVLAALYNRAKPQGLGFIHFTPEDMTNEEAQAMLDAGQDYFDYVKGRVMKVKLQEGDTEFDPRLYDRDNGEGSAEGAVAPLRA